MSARVILLFFLADLFQLLCLQQIHFFPPIFCCVIIIRENQLGQIVLWLHVPCVPWIFFLPGLAKGRTKISYVSVHNLLLRVIRVHIRHHQFLVYVWTTHSVSGFFWKVWIYFLYLCGTSRYIKKNKSKRCKKVKKKPHQKKVKEKKEINKKFRSACILCVLWLIVSLLTWTSPRRV